MQDQEIIDKVLQGDINVFEEIMKKYNEKFYRIAIAYMKDPEETEDAMQSAYLKIFENLGKFRGQSGFGTWAIRILINECKMMLRKKRNTLEIINQMTKNIKRRIGVKPSDAILMNKELKQFLEKSILDLPLKYRSIFIMREINGLSVKETAQALSLSEANVKVRLHRAKEQMRTKILEANKTQVLFDFHLRRCTPLRKRVMQLIFAAQRQNS